jgi:sigma54-dependent transcription regulator
MRGAEYEPSALPRTLFSEDAPAAIDLFDRPQLAAVISACRGYSSLAAAGRALFSVSRASIRTGRPSADIEASSREESTINQRNPG